MNFTSKELRHRFLQFFNDHRHFIEKSAPLIPHDDPTLLFVNAGMVQFKNVFTQKEHRSYTRATTSQKCIRAGGKHNDLENVGHTARHHTFFEMLGNFSFGDYFKEEAITLAWEFLTKVIGLDQSRLSVSVFAGDETCPADDVAEKIWHEKIGLPKERIRRLGRADNFWQMGDTGPCGPCTEIYFDRSDIDVGFGGQTDDDKIIEIWNLVFMQYEMFSDGSLKPLPAPCVDTGMGLERLAAVVNRQRSNYDTDLLRPLIKKAEVLSKINYQGSDALSDVAMRVIADHARATAFLIADGLFPSNESRGYVLRRFMRRAIRHGAHLGFTESFFHTICLEVAAIMGDVYPELIEAKSLIEKVVLQEEEAFRKTLDRGLMHFSVHTKDLKKGDTLSGDVVFRLYETYGFPKDLTEDLAKEKDLVIDWTLFHQAEKQHEERSAQGLGLKGVDDLYLKLHDQIAKTQFVDENEVTGAKVLAILKNNQNAESLSAKETGVIILDKTPFYGESGGQIGDTGEISNQAFSATVVDTKKTSSINLHMVEARTGSIRVGDVVTAVIDWPRRQAIRRNHSATHLLHSALREILGSHVTQKGSLVAPDRLRFDFSHFSAMSRDEISNVEDKVNAWILDNEAATIQEMSMEDAKAYGAVALFGEKYDNVVRVLDMGSHSTELCGGTHCHRTGDIGSFRIISEGPLAQGIRRIEAITGDAVIAHSRLADQQLKDISSKLSAKNEDVSARIDQILAQLRERDRDIKLQTTATLKDKADQAIAKAINLGSIDLVSEIVDALPNAEMLRTYADLIRDRMKSGVVALGYTENDDKAVVLIATTKDLSATLHAGKMVSEIAPLIGGKGGGRPDFAQAGGTKPQGLSAAMTRVKEILAAC